MKSMPFHFLRSLSQLLFVFLITIVASQLSVAQSSPDAPQVSQHIYFTGNLGIADEATSNKLLQAISQQSQQDESAVFVALGNTTGLDGFPESDNKRTKEKDALQRRAMNPLSTFNGPVIYIPGKNEWNSSGHDAIDDLESYLQDHSKGKFWPNDGCPIERESISDQVELLMVDSQWYFEDWDDHPYINNKCEIKTREQFFLQFKDELKDEQNKTIIVALYHPVISDKRKNLIELMGGFSNESFYSNSRQYYTGRLESLASQFEDVIFVSGGEGNLQYIYDDGIPQIITGASGKNIIDAVTGDSKYASTNVGYTKLTVFTDGSSTVQFYEWQNDAFVPTYKTIIKSKTNVDLEIDLKPAQAYDDRITASIYTDEETEKSGFYRWFWGDHYRDLYSKDINVPVLRLEDLPHNVRAITAGGGNQSRSLRLIDDNDNEFTVRELRKSALRFIQSKIKDHYVLDYLDDTVAEDVVQDYYTTAHPFAQFAIGDLLTAIDIPHVEPKIVYLPKQERLGRFNETYGDKLYMFEEHVGDENINLGIFGKADDIISTADLLLELRNDKDARIDEDKYVRARLFDMLVGDWDRHQDQWRWKVNKQTDGTIVYSPIPRDRDQAFSKYDGVFPALLKLTSPLARNMQSYAPDIKDMSNFNNAVYYLDKTLINTASYDDWREQAMFIQQELTDEVIDNAFAGLEPDTQDESIDKIVTILKQRRENLVDIADDYFKYFKKHEVVVATTKDNNIDVVRKQNGLTTVTISQKGVTLLENTYNKESTSELWLYALDGDDIINVTGEGSNYIHLKIFGGEENDVYNIENRRNLTVYDYRTKKNTFNGSVSKRLTDSYDINNFDPQKRKYATNVILPGIGFDPDAGFSVAAVNTYTTYSLLRNPFTTQHRIAAKYYGATQGIEGGYYGEFAHVFYNWNLGVEARFTSNSFAINYFGDGNNTSYDNDAVDLDFNRVSIQQWHVQPSLIFKKTDNLTAHIAARLESNEVLADNNEFILSQFPVTNDVYLAQVYAGGEVGINFNNKQNLISYQRRGIELGLVAGYKRTIDEDFNNEFTYIEPTASFILPLAGKGIAALASKVQARFIIGDNYEFYHGSTVGGNRSLRGFRNDRFNGQTSFFQSTDLRVGIAQFRTGFAPLRLGVSAGYDLGRVWQQDDTSNQWHDSYGGSVFITGFQAFTANLGYYTSAEDSRVIFTAGFAF